MFSIQDVIINLLKTTIISSVLILFILLLKTTWLKRYSKNLNYYIWLFVIIRLIVPLEIPIKYTFSEKNKISQVSDMVVSMQSSIEFDTYFYIFVFYLIGVMILSIYSIMTYLKYKKMIKKLSYDVDDDFTAIFNEVKNEMSVDKNIVIRYCDYVKSPCLIGVFRPYILVPNVGYSCEEISWILRHELTHYKYKDNLIKLICFLIRIVYWFNPLVYLLIHVMENDCELSCDQRVVKDRTFDEKKEYGLAITNSVKYSINLKEKFEKEYYMSFSDSKKLKRRLQDLFVKKLKAGYFAAVAIFAITLGSFVNLEFDYLLKTEYEENDIFTISVYTYTYKDAPPEVREFHEKRCKARGVVPKDSDIIDMSDITLKKINKNK
ncbi:MAG: M56 family metallopeptidase [Intestinibacter sp.]|uniref:M56 family metallopeptidase n=1 Tax=Intestinibacter sp. TaxID=1965304 RepID=UPI0025BE2584|nr:M56 family metallopeptidase [Intestinibacter sp.]MCI6736782.1 M56 family metallopeptidase [Intestinibacter sp.]